MVYDSLALHCRVLPLGVSNVMIPEPLRVYSDDALTVFQQRRMLTKKLRS